MHNYEIIIYWSNEAQMFIAEVPVPYPLRPDCADG